MSDRKLTKMLFLLYTKVHPYHGNHGEFSPVGLDIKLFLLWSVPPLNTPGVGGKKVDSLNHQHLNVNLELLF